MTKKVYKQLPYMSVITKNLNWEVLRDGTGLRMKNVKIYRGLIKKYICKEEFPKRGLRQFADWRGGAW